MVTRCAKCQESLRTLGITQSATDEQVKQSFKDYVRVWHPDRFGHDDRLRRRAEEETKRLNAAYDHLQTHVASEPAWREEPAAWYESPVVERETTHAVPVEPTQPVLWRWIKVILRTVWRVFKLVMMLLFGALLVLSLVIKLFEYFGDRNRHEKGDLNAGFKSWRTELYVAELLGVPIVVVEGLMFISAVLVVDLGLLGTLVWSYLAPHRVFVISLVALISLVCVCWATMAEYEAEFIMHSSTTPRTGAWVMGLLVLLGSYGSFTYVAASTTADITVSQTTSPPFRVATSSALGEPRKAEAQNKLGQDSANVNNDGPKDDEAEQASEQLTTPTEGDSEIRDAVAGWKQAFLARDAARLAAYYAPEIEQYFRKQNIPRSQVQEYADLSLARVESIPKYEISDIRTVVFDSSRRATATFHKQWEMNETDGKTFSGEEIERLTFAMTDEGWKIVREEELNIIRATRQ